MFNNPIITRSVQKFRLSVGKKFGAKQLSVANTVSSSSTLNSTITNSSSTTLTPIEAALPDGDCPVTFSNRSSTLPEVGSSSLLQRNEPIIHNRSPSKSLLRSETAQSWWITMTTPWGKRKGVSFGNVTVREYNRSIGDWWDIPNGLGLGWEYVEHPSTQIEELTDEELAERARLKNLIRGVRYKISTYRLVLRYRCSSKGTIQVDKCSDESMGGETRSDRKRRERKLLARKKMRRQCLTWEDTNRTTSRLRESLLKNFGFTPEEMELSERERKLLRMEYTQWTQKARQQEGQKMPSKLFLERFVADIRHSLPRVRSCAAAAAAATGIECKSIANNSKISPEE